MGCVKKDRYDFFDIQDLRHLMVCADCGVPVLGFSVEAHDRYHEQMEGAHEPEEAA